MKTQVSLIISIIPINWLKITLYRIILGYRISYDTKIGMLNILNCSDVEIDKGRIGSFNFIKVNTLKINGGTINRLNRILNANEINVEKGALINVGNKIIGSKLSRSEIHSNQMNLFLGNNCEILRNCIVDLSGGEIFMKANVVLGGVGTQIWTHGFNNYRVFVKGGVNLGVDIFIGSRSIITQGVTVCNNVIIGAGSVVAKSIVEPGFYVSSQLVLKKNF